MTALLATRAARRRGIAFIVLLVISALMMAFSANPAIRDVQNAVSTAFRPVQGALHEVAAGVASVVDAFADIDRLRTENDALHSENDRLAAENERLEAIRRENASLSALLGLRSTLDFQTAPAVVIARESSEFRRLVVLDKGTDAGISVGDVVVGPGGSLAGRVVEVGAESAKVVLVNDGSSVVIGQIASNAATGEVLGQLGPLLLMRQIDAAETVLVGDTVVTAGIELASGLRSAYPKGLLIGRVVDVRRDPNDIVQTAFVEPAAKLDKLDGVLVITDYEGGLPPIEQQPVDCSGATLPQGEQPCLAPRPSATPAASGGPSAGPSRRPTPKP